MRSNKFLSLSNSTKKIDVARLPVVAPRHGPKYPDIASAVFFTECEDGGPFLALQRIQRHHISIVTEKGRTPLTGRHECDAARASRRSIIA